MALPDKDLTTGQSAVMDPLIVNFKTAKARLEASQKMYNAAVTAMEEYISQAAEKQQIAVGTDYAFSLDTRKFVDKAAFEAAVVGK